MDIQHADTFAKRLTGLLGTRKFPDYDGLYFPDVRCIHTFFMQYPIDVLFLDDNRIIGKCAERVKPFRVIWGPFSCSSIVELRPGFIAQAQIKKGDIFPI